MLRRNSSAMPKSPYVRESQQGDPPDTQKRTRLVNLDEPVLPKKGPTPLYSPTDRADGNQKELGSITLPSSSPPDVSALMRQVNLPSGWSLEGKTSCFVHRLHRLLDGE